MKFERRFRRKKNCTHGLAYYLSLPLRVGVKGIHTPRIKYSRAVPHDSGRDRKVEIADEKVDVCSVVVSFAKRPFRAAKAPEERARRSHFECAEEVEGRDRDGIVCGVVWVWFWEVGVVGEVVVVVDVDVVDASDKIHIGGDR